MLWSQTPRVSIEPPRVGTDGTDASRLYGAYSSPLDPWQDTVLAAWLGYGEDGHYTAMVAGISMPRQNGKNYCIEAREFFGLIVNGEKILHTAHQVVTARAAFDRLISVFENDDHPEIKSMIKRIRRTNGEEAIELKNGGKISFSARSRQKARGFDGISLVVFDEAQELTDDQIEAILAVLSASATGERQLIYAGTPPYPNCPGTVFRRVRDGAAEAESTAWHEWSVEAASVDEIDVADENLWYACNPALGIRHDVKFVRVELAQLAPDGFARERLGWWQPVKAEAEVYVIDRDKWAACASDAPKPEGRTAYGVKFSPDGATVTLCGAARPEDGAVRISLIAQRPTLDGIQWLVDWLNQRASTAACVVIDGRNGAAELESRLLAPAGAWPNIKSGDYKAVIIANPGIVVSAATALIMAVAEKSLTWYTGQPTLRDSALGATKRQIGGGFGFGGENSPPIEAASLALWGLQNCKRNPDASGRIG